MVESNIQVWSLYNIGDIEKLGSIEWKFIMFPPGMFSVTYSDWLECPGLESMEIMRNCADLIMTYEMVHRLNGID